MPCDRTMKAKRKCVDRVCKLHCPRGEVGDGLRPFFISLLTPAAYAPIFGAVSSCATKVVAVIHHGVSTSVPAAVISHPSRRRTGRDGTERNGTGSGRAGGRFPDRCPSAARSDLRGLTFDLLSLLTRPDCGGGAVLAGINRFLPDSIFIYLSLSEGCYRHRDSSARAHARDVKPGQSVSFPCIPNQARVSQLA